MQNRVQCFEFVPIDVEKTPNKLVLNMGCFIILLKLNGHFLQNQTSIQRRKGRQSLNLKDNNHDEKMIYF